MKRLKRADVEQIFERLEVSRSQDGGPSHGYVEDGGSRVLLLHANFEGETMPQALCQRFRRALRLTSAEFEELESGEMDREQYLELLRSKGDIK
jgi:hypothetical protein